MEEENEKKTLFKFKRFCKECLRVLKVTKKPNSLEFKTIVKASGLGILVLGLLGFIVQMIGVLFK